MSNQLITSNKSEINNIIEKNLYPGPADLYQIVKNKYPDITMSQVQEYLKTLPEYQLTFERHQTKAKMGHIVSYDPYSIVQIDLFDLSKYSYDYSQYKVKKKLEDIRTVNNKGYKYIFAFIDVFSRWADCIMMKSKDEDDCIKAFNLIVDFHNIKPKLIMSDSDSSFLGKKFKSMLESKNIRLDPVVVDNHRALGVIDRFARTLKTRLTKVFIGKGDTNWVDYLDTIMPQYNNSKHRGILNYTPNEILMDKKIQDIIREYNYQKSSENQTLSSKTDLNNGDQVRLYIDNKFRKGTEPNYTNKVYTVKEKIGKNLLLTNGKRVVEHNVLKVKDDNQQLRIQNGDSSDEEPMNIIDETNKQNKITKRLKQVGITRPTYDALNEPRQQRTKRAPEKLNL